MLGDPIFRWNASKGVELHRITQFPSVYVGFSLRYTGFLLSDDDGLLRENVSVRRDPSGQVVHHTERRLWSCVVLRLILRRVAGDRGPAFSAS